MSETATLIEQKEKTAQLMWTCIILGFFLIQAVIWVVAFSVTLGDPSHAVVTGYAEKALHWDEEKAVRFASERLGWMTQINIDPSGDMAGNRAISLTVKDAQQSPVTAATIQLVAYHVARAAEPQTIVFSAVGDGVYTGTMQIRKTGQWQFDGEVMRGHDIHVVDQRQEIVVSR